MGGIKNPGPLGKDEVKNDQSLQPHWRPSPGLVFHSDWETTQHAATRRLQGSRALATFKGKGDRQTQQQKESTPGYHPRRPKTAQPCFSVRCPSRPQPGSTTTPVTEYWAKSLASADMTGNTPQGPQQGKTDKGWDTVLGRQPQTEQMPGEVRHLKDRSPGLRREAHREVGTTGGDSSCPDWAGHFPLQVTCARPDLRPPQD